jgi:hypothetical protein
MNDALGIFLAFAIPLSTVLALYPALDADSGRRVPAVVLLGIAFAFVPLLVPSDGMFLRTSNAVFTLACWCKIADLRLSRRPAPPFWSYVAFILNPTVLVMRMSDRERSQGARVELRRALVGLALGALGAGLAYLVFVHLEPILPRHPLRLLKLLTFYLAVLGGLGTLVALVRLAGQPGRILFGNIYTAATPAEFWQRYNRAMGQFLYEDIFKKVGGRRAPVRGTLVTFLFSALIHEWAFDIGRSRIDGTQFAFFMVQGVAAALTLRARPKGAARFAAILGTLAFNDLSSLLFFVGVDGIFPSWLQL